MIIRFVFLCLAFCFISGCGFKAWVAREFMQGTLADGVSRLSVQHGSILTGVLNQRLEKDAEVEIIPSEKPDEHGRGTVIYTLKNYVIDFSNEETVHQDCNDDIALWRGKVTVNATKTMQGRLTNNPKSPIIPDPLSVRIDIEAKAENLSIYFPSKDERMKIIEGIFQFTAYPRLAQSPSGMRLTVTSNTRFENFHLKNMRVLLSTKDIEMEIPIFDSMLAMQVGKGEHGDENTLSGNITIFDNTHTVPRDGLGLDPDYNAEKFLDTYACHEDFKESGVSYEHVSIDEKLAPAVSALSGRVMAILAGNLETNSTCGFLAGPTVATISLRGKPGELGSYEENIPSECMLEFKNYQTKPDCFGVAYVLNGRVSIPTAKKILAGQVTIDESQLKSIKSNYTKKYAQGATVSELSEAFPKAVIPQSRQPISFMFDAAFDNFSLTDICTKEGLKDHKNHCLNKKFEDSVFSIFSGTISATIKPILAKDLREGDTKNFCVIPTSAGEAQINFSHAKVSINRGGNHLHVAASADYQLINGQVGDKENELFGHMCIADSCISLDNAHVDSGYDRQLFLDGMFLCDNTMEWTKNDDECRIEDSINENVARLLVVNAGALVKIASSSQMPGSFSSLSAIKSRELSNNGTTLILKASQKNEVQLDKKLLEQVDGIGTKERIHGFVSSLEGAMTRTGVSLEQKGFLHNFNPLNNRFMEGLRARFNDRQEVFVRPTNPTATKINVKAHVRDFSVISQKPHENHPMIRLQIDNADYVIEAIPVMAMDERTKHEPQPSFSITTPIIHLRTIEVRNLSGRIIGVNFELPVHVSHASLNAFNGRYLGQGNFMEGTVKLAVGNQAQEVKSYHIERTHLNQAYSQDEFDQAYQNTPHLSAVLSPN